MADKKKSGISVMPEFVDGEQPSAQKFNSIGAQVKASDYNLEVSIGDIWDESYPYSGISNKTLSLNKIKSNGAGTEYIDTNSRGNKLDIVSLGRLIGPASNLNPVTLSYDQNGALYKTIYQEQISATSGNEHAFAYLPVGGSSLTFTDTATFANSVATLSALSSAGDYHVDFSKGVIYTYSPITQTSYVTYQTNPTSYEGGGSPIGASYNVIPDPAQVNLSTSNQLTITLEADGSYLVVLPTVSHEASNKIGNTTLLNVNRDVNATVQLTLPLAVVLACSSGQYASQIGTDTGIPGTIIPEGILYLRDETTLEVYTEATYFYVNNYSFKIKTTEELDIANHKFSVITVGNNITSCIQDLSRKQFFHSHSREFGEPLVQVEDLGGNYKRPGSSGSFIPSSVENNYFSQYLHRDGSRDEDTGINDDNAMRGNLIIGRKQDTNGNDITEAGKYLGEGSSYYLNFGNNGTAVPRIGKYYNPAQNLGTFQIQSGFNCNIQLYTNNNIQLLSQGDEIAITATSGNFTSLSNQSILTSNDIFKIRSLGTSGLDKGVQVIGGLVSRSFEDESHPVDGVDFVSTGEWFWPRLSEMAYSEINQFVYAVQDRDDTVSTATNQNDANFLKAALDLPNWMKPSANVYIYDITVLWQAGAANDPPISEGRDNNDPIGINTWWGESTKLNDSTGKGVCWHLNDRGSSDSQLVLIWPCDTTNIGVGEAVIHQNSTILDPTNGTHYGAYLDLRILIRYRVGI